MLGLFLQPNAVATIAALDLPDEIKRHCAEVTFKGYTMIPGAVPGSDCARLIEEFRVFEARNCAAIAQNQDELGHYQRDTNLHPAMPELTRLFTCNEKLLAVSAVPFGARTALYLSLFYETGSLQPIHRDTPAFCTRPEYLYFGNTVYLEEAGDENGCLEVIEGGHLVGELNRESMGEAKYRSLEQVPADDGELWITVVDRCRKRGLTKTKLYVQAGDSLIWHPQLPYGGSPILDQSRTRFSLVIHTTPEGVPAYHQDAFFRPAAPYSETAPPWTYEEFEGRKIANRQGISFGHLKSFPLNAFRPG